MYKPPTEYTDLVKAINDNDETQACGKTLVNVEAILTLAEELGVNDEPITVGWVLLDGTPTPNERLNTLTDNQRHMIANARQFIPLNSRFAWDAALRDYASIPLPYRNYDVVSADLDKQIINACKIEPVPHPEHIDKYRRMLTKTLSFRHTTRYSPEANVPYTFVVTTAKGVQRGRVRFEAEHAARLEKTLADPWFTEDRPRKPFRIRLRDLKKTAKLLDRKERALGNRVHWAADLAKIRYQRVEGIGTQARLHLSDILDIDGFFHIAGIVSSGKTTLAILIAAHIILHEMDIRITFVVGDTNTAVQLAHRFNVWFREDPAKDSPVAVPILGQSTRSVHLKRLLISREYQDSKAKGRPHWGERWLSPVCPLQALVEWEQADVKSIPIGNEPCQRLEKSVAADGGKYVKRHLCPLFAICPSKQLYRDMPAAKLWITTPGALSQSAPPRHLESRPIKIGDLVYEQSDLVIFDEAETIVDWFDSVYAQNLALTDGGNGLVDRLDTEVTSYFKPHRAPAAEFQKWLFAERAASKAVTGVLTSLDKTQGQNLELIRNWVKSGRFTRNSLSYRLSRRLAGLKEYESNPDISVDQRREEEKQARTVLQIFEELNHIHNPLRQQPAPEDSDWATKAAYALTEIMQPMNSAGLDVDTDGLLSLCEAWLDGYFSNIDERLDDLKARLDRSDNKADGDYVKKDQLDRGKRDLAMRLFFTLWVVVLDWHLNIVFHEWHRKPDEINVEQPYAKIPRNLRNILPIPATGAQYGLYRVPKSTSKSNANYLTQFVHVNIGRAYVLNFHRLRTDLDGQRGPNVLAMSGTSYLPASSRFNLQMPPSGVLSPDERTQQGLRKSCFEFKPFYDEKERPIKVSGVPKKLAALNKMMLAMMRDGPTPGGFLERVLERLRQLEESDPDQWGDRVRLLLFTNSYDQAESVAQTLQKLWPQMAEHIFYLCRGKDNQDYEVSQNNIERVDIEQFADTGGMILVAPMQSIGRGFNILNKRKPTALAAFGAVFFLTRPMWQPEDFVSMAQEINRYTVQWAAHGDVPEALAGADGLYNAALALRETAQKLWGNIELRRGYSSLNYPQADGSLSDLEPDLLISPRRDLAATTAGLIIQAIGRLLRGGVPFHAYFTDAAWSPETADKGRTVTETAATSLLQAMIDVIAEYADPADAVGHALYGDLAESISTTAGLNGN